MTRTLREEANGFKLSEHAFGARKLGEHEVLFVVEAADELLATHRVNLIASEFFGLGVGTMELVRLERTVNAVPNFLEAFFQSMDVGNGGNSLTPSNSTLH